MKRKLLSILLSLVMVLSLLPTAALAEDGVTLTVNQTKGDDTTATRGGAAAYKTIEAAIEAAKSGDTIQLTGDIELSSVLTIPEGKTFTLDLNGKNITQTGTYWKCDCGSTACNHQASAKQEYKYNAINLSSGIMTITDNNTETEHGTITGYNGVKVLSGAELIVDGGTIIGEDYAGIYNNGGTVTINGGTFSGDVNAVETCDGQVTINGGTFESDIWVQGKRGF